MAITLDFSEELSSSVVVKVGFTEPQVPSELSRVGLWQIHKPNYRRQCCFSTCFLASYTVTMKSTNPKISNDTWPINETWPLGHVITLVVGHFRRRVLKKWRARKWAEKTINGKMCTCVHLCPQISTHTCTENEEGKKWGAVQMVSLKLSMLLPWQQKY